MTSFADVVVTLPCRFPQRLWKKYKQEEELFLNFEKVHCEWERLDRMRQCLLDEPGRGGGGDSQMMVLK